MTIFLWGFYILGNVFTVWKRANLSVSKDFTPWNNLKQYLVSHGPTIGINFLLSSGLFWTMWHDTTFLTKMLLYIGIQKDIEVPLNPFTAAIYGVFSDTLMDFITAKITARVPVLAPLQPKLPPTGEPNDPQNP
jgi:hypothetical protein